MLHLSLGYLNSEIQTGSVGVAVSWSIRIKSGGVDWSLKLSTSVHTECRLRLFHSLRVSQLLLQIG